MKLHEYQARQILDSYKIPTSCSTVFMDAQDAAQTFQKLGKSSAVAKVQVLMGGRGKAGGVVHVRSGEETKAFALKFLGKPFSTSQSAGEPKIVRSILLTEDKKILEEPVSPLYNQENGHQSNGKPIRCHRVLQTGDCCCKKYSVHHHYPAMQPLKD